tara:strand:+ start:2737 stop:3318 length:582 start_codon:yes stop_codon:yes gene_type:complete
MRAMAGSFALMAMAAKSSDAGMEPAISVVNVDEKQLKRLARGNKKLESLLLKAHESIGVEYKWGATSLKRGLDCSNLTWKLFRSEGFDYRGYLNTRGLAAVEERNGLCKIDYKNAKAGDLLVYGFNDGRKWTGHVVILIDRLGKISGHKGLVLGAHGDEVGSVEYVTFRGFDKKYFKQPEMKLANVLRVDGLW